MKYVAITGATASWLLGKPGLLDSLHQTLIADEQGEDLKSREFVEGPLRISTSVDGSTTALWNVDYLHGTGDDPWGFISFDAEEGLGAREDISREVLERAFYVISQRAQGLLIDGALIHRSWEDDTHTCLAGRGTEARQVSIGYVERTVHVGSTQVRTLLIHGPRYDFRDLRQLLVTRASRLKELLGNARSLYDPGRKKLSLDQQALSNLRSAVLAYVTGPSRVDEYGNVSVGIGVSAVPDRDAYRTVGWSYWEWTAPDSPLSPVQRKLLESDAMSRHPIRIIGPAGSGKTLLMQLLALRRLELAKRANRKAKVLYLVHNGKMAESVRHRFSTLLSTIDKPLLDEDRVLTVKTLSQYGVDELGLDASQIIDPDAQQSKEFQLDTLREALSQAMRAHADTLKNSALFRELERNQALLPLFTLLVMSEISTAIKGHGLSVDERRYVESERALSRLHGILTIDERRVLYAAFKQYHGMMFDGYGVLDSDDVAISLLGKLRTPIWELKRRDLGFDHVFVDETQLFNENERRILPLLAKSTSPYVPIVLALDEAQDVYGYSKAGLATIGIEGIANENLQSIHRSSRAIVRLAFFIIQQSTDLFGPDFPDFTTLEGGKDKTEPSLDEIPKVETIPEAQKDFGKFVLRRIRALRKANQRQIVVICMAERYWQPILLELRGSDLPLHVLESRGERIGSTQPVVVLTRPAHIGGQEFDATLIVGAEQGLLPPRVVDNDALASAVEQQALRELYISVTRARKQVTFVLSRGASLTPVLADAQKAGLLTVA